MQHRAQRRQQRRRRSRSPRLGCLPGCSATVSGVSSVLIGTGTTPARSAPQKAIGKSTVSCSSSTTRRSRPMPALARAPAKRQVAACELRVGQGAPWVLEGDAGPSPSCDVPIDEPTDRVAVGGCHHSSPRCRRPDSRCPKRGSSARSNAPSRRGDQRPTRWTLLISRGAVSHLALTRPRSPPPPRRPPGIFCCVPLSPFQRRGVHPGASL